MMAASYAPILVEVTFCFDVNGDTAKASFDCPAGELPSREDIAEAAQSIKQQVLDQFPNARWQTRDEFVQLVLEERQGVPRGVRVSIPGPLKFEAEWLKEIE